MIAREKVLALLGVANASGQAVELKPYELAELCRVYLAWLDAPTTRMIQTFTYDNDFLAASDLSVNDEERLSGKVVRLVEIK